MKNIIKIGLEPSDENITVAAHNQYGRFGTLQMHYDSCVGYVYNFYVEPGNPITVAPRMVLEAARWFQERGVESVLIQVEGKNVNRKFYRRLGFVDVPKVPRLMATTIQEVLAALKRFDR